MDTSFVASCWRQMRVVVMLTLLLLVALGCQDKSGEQQAGGEAPEEQSVPHSSGGEVTGARLDGTRAPSPGLLPIDKDGRMAISEHDRCPVCAMAVAKHPRFAGAIEMKDGRTFYFCGTGCMMKAWLHPAEYLSERRDQVRRALVREYFSGEEVDAADAVWIAGSDVVGPMGPAVVPLRDNATELASFEKRHGGRRRFRFAELDDQLFLEITGKAAVRGEAAVGGEVD